MTERHHPQEPVALLLAGVGMPVAPADDEAPTVDIGGIRIPIPAAAAPASPPISSTLRALDAQVEAILMVADRALPLPALAVAVDRPVAVVRQAVDRIRLDYDGESGTPRRGYELRETASGWRLFVRAEHDSVVREFLSVDQPSKLSQAALETLAVIAYRQPVTRGQVAAIRAVAVDSVMRTLVGRGLIEEVNTDPETGAVLYGTTEGLLNALGILSISALPPIAPLLDDVHEVAGLVR